MGFLPKDISEVRLTLTDYGKTEFYGKGLNDTFRYFSFSDDGVIYHLCVEPQGILDITGSHKSSTTRCEPKYTVKINK
tara:strand:+ start:589 stop:822 length:234 start_codon:yes stop_codon:yes gene_type:complete